MAHQKPTCNNIETATTPASTRGKNKTTSPIQLKFWNVLHDSKSLLQYLRHRAVRRSTYWTALIVSLLLQLMKVTVLAESYSFIPSYSILYAPQQTPFTCLFTFQGFPFTDIKVRNTNVKTFDFTEVLSNQKTLANKPGR